MTQPYRLFTTLLLLIVTGSFAASAQDRIYMTRGAVLEGRVTSVGRFWVRYYSYEGNDTISKHKDVHYIDRIVYKDGHIWRKRPAKEDIIRENKAIREQRRVVQETGFPNAITLNFPTYMDIAHFPGVTVGLGYERFVDKKGKYSVSLSINRYWAGTAANGELRNGEVRANIQGGYVMPGFLWHTAAAGNAAYIDCSVGAVFPVGNILRRDVTGGPSSYSYGSYSERTSNTLAAGLLQANFCLHLGSHFIFTTSVSGGPMLAADNTRGSLWLVGFKLGGRF